MGLKMPKQFLSVAGMPILYYPLKTFLDTFPEGEIIVVFSEDYMEMGAAMIQSWGLSGNARIVEGGPTRFHSVWNGINAIQGKGIVFVHDSVRPMLSPELLLRCCEGAERLGNCVPAVACTDSVRQYNGQSFTSIDRDALRCVQTPQVFQVDLLREAFRQTYQESFTDEASVVERLGHTIHLIEGERKNIKITTPEDLVMAEYWLSGSI